MGWTGLSLTTGGAASYVDIATQGTPINPAATTWTTLPNDALGAGTFEELPNSLTGLWDADSDQFDFSALAGRACRLTIRADLVVIAAGSNTVVEARFRGGDGSPAPFNLPGGHVEYKAAGTYSLSVAIPVYVRAVDPNFTGYPGLIQVWSDKSNTNFWVRDWYIALEL